jgi:hypothetical protein
MGFFIGEPPTFDNGNIDFIQKPGPCVEHLRRKGKRFFQAPSE